jgi:hypothetical protein
MKKMTEMTENDLRFEDVVTPLVKWIRKKWNWKGLKPKNYKKYLENYQDYQDMEDLEIKGFEGALNNNVMSFTFPEQTSICHVAYDDKNQGRDPLTVLVSASVNYGMSVHRQRVKLGNIKMMEKHNKMLQFDINFFKSQIDIVPEEQKELVKYMVSALEKQKLESFMFKD